MDDKPNHLGTDELSARLDAIERDIDTGRYRPGPWDAVIRLTKSQPDDARAAVAEDISRVSRKLHLRTARRTVPLAPALAIELAATALGGMLLALAVKGDFNTAAIAAMIIWVSTLQPLLKVAVGAMLGVGHEYGYLYGIEPRFKMKFGGYVGAPRWKRIALHTSGMVGSPLGAILVAWIAGGTLQIARSVCRAVFWITLAINLISMVLALLGVRRLGPLRLAEGSGGAAGLELREALGASRR